MATTTETAADLLVHFPALSDVARSLDGTGADILAEYSPALLLAISNDEVELSKSVYRELIAALQSYIAALQSYNASSQFCNNENRVFNTLVLAQILLMLK